MRIFLIFIGLIFLCPRWSEASVSLGCESSNKLLTFGYSFIEGDGLWTLNGDFDVTYNGKKAKSGLFNWFKMDNSDLSLTVFSLFKRQVHFIAHKAGPSYGYYRVISGFVLIDDISIDLKDLEIDCEEG